MFHLELGGLVGWTMTSAASRPAVCWAPCSASRGAASGPGCRGLGSNAVRRSASGDGQRAAPLRPPSVLRAPLRLLRLRDVGRAARRAQRVRRCARGRAGARARAPFGRGGDDLPGRRDAHVHRAGGVRAPAGGAARRGRGDGRGESGDCHCSARLVVAAKPREPRFSGRAELPGRTCFRCSSALPHPTTSDGPFTFSRDAGFDNFSLDLIYGIPGQSPADLASDLAEALALEPRASFRVRARSEAGHTLHARPRSRARAPGRVDGVIFRAGRRDADPCRLPLVRDRELLPQHGS